MLQTSLEVSIADPTKTGGPMRSMSGRTVSVERVSKHFGEVVAVDDVSLDVKAGEFVSLLGPSGSGKTTLLMMIAGFELPTAGRIWAADKDLTHVPPNKRNLGMVFQKYALFPHMTVAQNIAFPLRMRRLPAADISTRVDKALSLVRLDGYGDRVPSQLSGGQQQRIAVARALVFEPPVLLMDEPLGALDKKLREQMQIEIKALQERLGVTVIYVTHDQEEALTMSDRVAVMKNGRLAQIGTPVELYQTPNSPFVADFIGKMNFVDADVVEVSGQGVHLRLQGSDQTFLVANEAPPGDLEVSYRGPVRVAMRPERLKLTSPAEGGSGILRGVVNAAIFVGSFRVYLIDVAGRAAEPLHVQLPADGMTNSYERGDQVGIIVDRTTTRLFAPAGEAEG